MELPKDLPSLGRTVGWAVAGAVIGYVGHLTKRQVTNITTVVNDVLPQKLIVVLNKVSQCPGKISGFINDSCKKKLNEKFVSVFISPVHEEIIYRLILQEGSSTLLQSLGVPPTIAKVMTIAFTNLLFGLAHSPAIDSERFSGSFVSGLGLSLSQEKGGLISSILGHAMNNAIKQMLTISNQEIEIEDVTDQEVTKETIKEIKDQEI